MSAPEPRLPAVDAAESSLASTLSPETGGDGRATPPRWRRWAPWLVGAGVLGGAWHWTLAHGLPQWLPSQVQPLLAQQLGTPVTWQALDIQPWTLRVTLRGLRVGEPAAPLLQVRAITVQPSWEMVWRLAPVLRRVTVEGLQLDVVRTAPGAFNFSPLLAHWQRAHPPQPDTGEPPAKFAVFNIAVQDSRIRFDDRVLQQRHVVDQIALGVPFVANLPSFVDAEVAPSLSARVDGSQLKLAGETLPFQQSKRSEVQLHWQGVQLSQVMEAVQPFLPAALRPLAQGGEIAADLKLTFEARPSPEVPKLGVSGQVAVTGLDLGWAALPLPLPAPAGQPAARAPRAAAINLVWERLAFEGIDAQPLVRQAHVGRVVLGGVQARWRPAVAVPTAAGSGDEAQAQAKTPGPTSSSASAPASTPAPGSASAPKPAQPAPASPWAWSVGEVQVHLAQLDAQPWGEVPGVRPIPRLMDVRAQLKGLSSDTRAKPATWQLGWHDAAGGGVQAQGQVHLARQQATAQLKWTDWSLADWSQLGTWLAAAPVQLEAGRWSGSVQADWAPTGLSWQSGQLQLAEVRVAPRGAGGQDAAKALTPAQTQAPIKAPIKAQTQPNITAKATNRVQWALLEAQGLQGRWPTDAANAANATQRLIQIDRVRWQGLDVAVLREPANRWFGITLPAAGEPPAVSAPTTPASRNGASRQQDNAAKAATAAPRVLLGSFTCEACLLRLDDRSLSPAARLTLGPLQAEVSGVDTHRPGEPVRFKLDTRALDSGRIEVEGQARAEPLSVDSRVRTSRVELKALQPYLDPYVNVVLTGAQPEVDGRVVWRAATARQAQQLRFQGRLGVRELHLQDRVNAADFLSWRQLGLDGMQVAIDGDEVDTQLGQIRLQDFYGRIIVNPDGKLNLSQVLRSERDGATTSITTPQAAAAPATSASAPAPLAPASTSTGNTSGNTSATPPATPRPAPQLAWRGVKLQGGRVDFTDHFIQPNYSARLTQVQGEVSAVSSRQSAPADLSISGAVDDAAPLRISGKVQPLGPQLYTDIEGSAKGIELSRLSPYAARYAGYGIDKGTLSVTVHYKIDQGQLEASNRVFLDQFTFGEASNSPDAIKLPIRFAVSLLTNARGEIDLNLPISGSINDPKFSVGGIVWQVFVNLVTKAVTAPFALLGGGDGEELGNVPFAAGSAELSETARKRLDTLAKSLTERPALKLEATGHADVAGDTLALRQRFVQERMRVAKARATNQPLEGTQVAPAEEEAWLAAAYKAAELPNKPRNALGLPKSLPAAEMRSLLMAAAPAGDAQLRELADDRAEQVKAYLAARIAPERVRLTASQVDPVKAADATGGAAAGAGAGATAGRVQMSLH